MPRKPKGKGGSAMGASDAPKASGTQSVGLSVRTAELNPFADAPGFVLVVSRCPASGRASSPSEPPADLVSHAESAESAEPAAGFFEFRFSPFQGMRPRRVRYARHFVEASLFDRTLNRLLTRATGHPALSASLSTDEINPRARNQGKHVVVSSHLIQKTPNRFRGFLDQYPRTGGIIIAVNQQPAFRLDIFVEQGLQIEAELP